MNQVTYKAKADTTFDGAVVKAGDTVATLLTEHPVDNVLSAIRSSLLSQELGDADGDAAMRRAEESRVRAKESQDHLEAEQKRAAENLTKAAEFTGIADTAQALQDITSSSKRLAAKLEEESKRLSDLSRRARKMDVSRPGASAKKDK